MASVWMADSLLPQFSAQKGITKTDVLIIGGGIAGLLCAHHLNNAGVDCLIVEADTICSGVTKDTTAKITFQHGLIYDTLIRRFGTEKAQMYLEANGRALENYRTLCSDIDCDYCEKDSYVYSIDDRNRIEKELVALQKIGCHAEFAEKLPLPFDIAGAVKSSDQAQFNPLKFLSAIANGLKIFEHTEVCELEGTTAITNRGRIKAKRIIVATHFPVLNKHGSYFIKMYQHRSYAVAFENAEDINGMYVDCKKGGMSFRNYKNLLIIGGGGHRTGKKGGAWKVITDFARLNYPTAKEKYRWSAQDCMTLDGVPYIGPYSARTDNLYVATGFNKWGMTSSMVAADILCDMMLGKKNEFSELFSPSRTVIRPQLACNAAEAVVNLLTPTVPRCPHLGCALKWNKAEHSWDCPCHGSRFSESGKLLDNPATGNIDI